MVSHRTFTKVDLILDQKHTNTLIRIEIMQHMLLDQNRIRLEINNRKELRNTNIQMQYLEIRNTSLNNT